MNLASHIAKLLLTHDCVIIPHLGGFVANCELAKIVRKRNALMPAARQIGFNTNLTHNDGLLAQSYMKERNCNFGTAEMLINKEIDDIFSRLKENNQVEFGEIGTLSLNENGALLFEPNKSFSAAPQYYGLDELPFSPKHAVHETPFAQFMKYAAVITVAVLMLLPINTFDTRINTASLLPPTIDWNAKNIAEEQPAEIAEEDTVINVTEETAVAAQSTETYHVIIASFATERKANQYLQEIANYSFQNIRIVHCQNRYRVAVESFSDNADAAVFRDEFVAEYPDLGGAWIFEEKI
ncbi:MAG: SPOR domain-containing protein [Prevotellaceae bacterium]|jgi:hypothetical protein|nr:SPOR domain-containing protein [Prevotellaceae bacterium]